MALTPVEIRHIRLPRRFFGYGRGATQETLSEIVDSFEDVWRERADLADKVEQLESDLVRYRELEGLLRTTLVSAERAAGDLREHAQREADLIHSEAQAEARAITRRAAAERERLQAESRKLRALMRSALATLDLDREEEGELDGEDERPTQVEAA